MQALLNFVNKLGRGRNAIYIVIVVIQIAASLFGSFLLISIYNKISNQRLQQLALHVVIGFGIIVIMSIIDIIHLLVVNPTSEQILSIFGLYQSSYCQNRKLSMHDYLLTKYAENVKFAVNIYVFCIWIIFQLAYLRMDMNYCEDCSWHFRVGSWMYIIMGYLTMLFVYFPLLVLFACGIASSSKRIKVPDGNSESNSASILDM